MKRPTLCLCSAAAFTEIAAVTLFMTVASAASTGEPAEIAKDFCHAVAAQALCSKTFTMDKGTEQRMSTLANQKLRGEGVPLNPSCNAGYDEFYTMESAKGLEAACKVTLGLFGANGSRRAGLIKARSAPKLKLSEAKVEQLFNAVGFAEEISKKCPSLSMIEGYKSRLKVQTGVDYSESRGYFSKAYEQGMFRAMLNKGKTDLGSFCTAGLGKYGPTGSIQAGWLKGEAGAASGTANANPQPVQKTAVTRQPQTVLNDLPPRPADMDPVKVLGALPGIQTGSDCAPYRKRIEVAQSALASATSLKERIERTIELTGHGLAGQALCPAEINFAPSAKLAQEVAATGLESCHIVNASADKLRDIARPSLRKRLYRVAFGFDQATVWAYETFLPTCSKLMRDSIQRMVKYSKENSERNSKRYTCNMWSEVARAELKAARSLSRDKRYEDALAQLDTRALAAMYGVQEHCESKRGVYDKERWLTVRKQIQKRMTQ